MLEATQGASNIASKEGQVGSMFSSIDVVMILKKSRQDITDCVCNLEATRAETTPSVFTKIHAHYIISGNNLKPSQIERACSLSMEKYCSASLMLSKTVEITHSYEVIAA